jgi:diacylglycerol kinase family enzyme
MNSWLAIVNPSSGGRASGGRASDGRGARALDRLLAYLTRWTSTVVLTEYPGHATKLARDARAHEGLVVAGGDGTLFEVLQGLDRETQRLCIVPTGRGNSLARDLGVHPLRFGACPPERIDMQRIDLLQISFRGRDGRTSSVLSASTVAIGYPAEVAALAGGRLRALGSLSYVAAAARAVPKLRRTRITYPNEAPTERRLTGLLASNTRHAASFVVFPEADCSDGSFEAMEMVQGRAGQWLQNVSALSGVPIHAPPARTGLTELRIDMEDPRDLLVDGELYPGLVSVEIRMLPTAVTLACIRSSR